MIDYSFFQKFNLIFCFSFQVLGLVCLGFSLYAYFDEASFSHLVEKGASEIEGKKIPFNVFKTSSLLLIIASTIIVVISFFGCLGTYKVNLKT